MYYKFRPTSGKAHVWYHVSVLLEFKILDNADVLGESLNQTKKLIGVVSVCTQTYRKMQFQRGLHVLCTMMKLKEGNVYLLFVVPWLYKVLLWKFISRKVSTQGKTATATTKQKHVLYKYIVILFVSPCWNKNKIIYWKIIIDIQELQQLWHIN